MQTPSRLMYKQVSSVLKIKIAAFCIVFFSLFFISILVCTAQIYSHSIRFTAGVPKVIQNKALRSNYKGVYDLDLQYNYYLAKGFNLGIGARLSDIQISRFNFPNLKASNLYLSAGYLALGYDYRTDEKQLFSFQVYFGECFSNYTKLQYDSVSKNSYNLNSLSIEPKANYYFFLDPNVAIGIYVSYASYQQNFDPSRVGLSRFATFYPDDYKKNIQCVNFGLSVFAGFKGKRFKGEILPDYGNDQEIMNEIPKE